MQNFANLNVPVSGDFFVQSRVKLTSNFPVLSLYEIQLYKLEATHQKLLDQLVQAYPWLPCFELPYASILVMSFIKWRTSYKCCMKFP